MSKRNQRAARSRAFRSNWMEVPSDWAQVAWAYRRLVGVLALIAAVLWLPRSFWMEDAEKEFSVDPSRVLVNHYPHWVEDHLRERIRGDLANLPSVLLRNEDELDTFLERVADACSWIASVEAAVKLYPDQLELTLQLREPLAIVRDSRGAPWLVDESGTVLGPTSDAPELVRRTHPPLVHETKGAGPLARNREIRRASYKEGLRVAAEVAPFREHLKHRDLEVALIDVNGFGASGSSLSEVDLLTVSGVRIEWGRSQGNPRFGGLEAEPEAKIRAIGRELQRVDDVRDLEVIQAQFVDASSSGSGLAGLLADR